MPVQTYTMSLESKRTAIARSKLQTNPIVKPQKFKEYQARFKKFLNRHKIDDKEPNITFNRWYTLMNMPCECYIAEIWDYDIMPEVSVVKAWPSEELSDQNSTRKCMKCIKSDKTNQP